MEQEKNKAPTKDEILDQLYVSAKEIKILMPKLGINRCRSLIEEIQEEMRDKNYYIPSGKPKMALTRLVKKKY